MTLWLVALAVFGQAPVGCTKDTDCKGERVCEAGQCVDPRPAASTPKPEAPPTASAPAPNPADYPKVVRKNGVTCVQSLGADGVVREDCRASAADYSGTQRPVDPAGTSVSSLPPRVGPKAPERSSVVADFGALGSVGLLVAGNQVSVRPGATLHLSLAGRLSDFLALGGILNGTLGFTSGIVLGVVTLAPALRLGDAGHATIALGPSVLVVSSGVTAAALAGTLLVHGVIPVSGGFGVHLQFGLTFDSSGAFVTLGGGFGGSVF